VTVDERRLSPRQRSVLRVLADVDTPASKATVARGLWPGSGRRRRGLVALVLSELRRTGLVERGDDGRHRLTDEGRRALDG
jgi:predicted transcriptional regulator